MISITGVFDDTVTDDAAKGSNGLIGTDRFNRYSWRASLRLINWLTWNTNGEALPPNLQKHRDMLSPFLKKYSASVYGGLLTKPGDYYTYDTLYLLRADRSEGCEVDEDEPVKIIKQPIEILESSKFNMRVETWIDELKPTLEAPIAKLTDTGFEFYPSDIGNVQLEYVRYPVKAEIKTKQDDVFHDEVPDGATSIDYDFTESVRNHLIYFIIQQFTLNVKDRSLVELNTLSKP